MLKCADGDRSSRAIFVAARRIATVELSALSPRSGIADRGRPQRR